MTTIRVPDINASPQVREAAEAVRNAALAVEAQEASRAKATNGQSELDKARRAHSVALQQLHEVRDEARRKALARLEPEHKRLTAELRSALERAASVNEQLARLESDAQTALGSNALPVMHWVELLPETPVRMTKIDGWRRAVAGYLQTHARDGPKATKRVRLGRRQKGKR